MRTVLYIWLLTTTVASGQQKTSKTKPPGFENYKSPIKTAFTKFNLSKRINLYPFNKSSQIKIISYNLNFDGKIEVAAITSDLLNKKNETNTTNLTYNIPFELPRNNLDSLSLENVTQIKTLTIPQIEKVSDILYNTCSRLTSNCSETIRGCYFPRNAILFFDENDKVFEYLEICFECKVKETFRKMEHLDLSDYMYKDLEQYFNDIGIQTKSSKK